MTVLVTGAAGFIGSHTAEAFANAGHSVLGVDNLSGYYDPAQKRRNVAAVESAGVRFECVDLAEDELDSIVSGVGFVIHAAAQPGISSDVEFETYIRNNITATHRLIAALRRSDSLTRLLYVSTSSVYGSQAIGAEESVPAPTSYYGVTKLAAEQLALSFYREHGLPVCSIRPYSVYGPRERPEKLYATLIRCAYNNEPFTLYEGSREHVRSYTYVEDVVEAFLKAFENWNQCTGEIINIGTEKTHTTGEGMSLVEEMTGKKIHVKRVSPRPGDQKRTKAEIAKAKRLLGWDPTTTLREGLEKQIAWYVRQMHGRL